MSAAPTQPPGRLPFQHVVVRPVPESWAVLVKEVSQAEAGSQGSLDQHGVRGWQSLWRREGITPNSYLLGGCGWRCSRLRCQWRRSQQLQPCRAFWGAGCGVAMGWLPRTSGTRTVSAAQKGGPLGLRTVPRGES